jgi:hypothetical protein
MSIPKVLVPIAVLSLTMPFLIMAATTPKKHGSIKTLSQQEQMKLALSAAPPHVAKEAAVLVFGEDGKLMEARPGSNGFTCIPTVMNLPIPDPMCMDASAKQWLDDIMQNAPKPSNAVPGIAYMAAGGSHWEKQGEVVMNEEPGAKAVKEPPHWMNMWPFDSKTSKLPKKPNPSGVYIMFDGTPYAHLMIYQDPKKMK